MLNAENVQCFSIQHLAFCIQAAFFSSPLVWCAIASAPGRPAAGLAEPGGCGPRGCGGRRAIRARAWCIRGRRRWVRDGRGRSALIKEERKHGASAGEDQAEGVIHGDGEHWPEETRARRGKPESDRSSDQQIEDGCHSEHATLGLGDRGRRKCGTRGRSRTRGRCRRRRRSGRILAGMLFLEAADHKVRIDPDRGRIRAREGATEDAPGPPRQVVRLESPQEGNRQLRLVGNRCQGNTAPFTFTAQPGSKRGRLGHQLRVRYFPAIAGISEREYASAWLGWQADLGGRPQPQKSDGVVTPSWASSQRFRGRPPP